MLVWNHLGTAAQRGSHSCAPGAGEFPGQLRAPSGQGSRGTRVPISRCRVGPQPSGPWTAAGPPRRPGKLAWALRFASWLPSLPHLRTAGWSDLVCFPRQSPPHAPGLYGSEGQEGRAPRATSKETDLSRDWVVRAGPGMAPPPWGSYPSGTAKKPLTETRSVSARGAGLSGPAHPRGASTGSGTPASCLHVGSKCRLADMRGWRTKAWPPASSAVREAPCLMAFYSEVGVEPQVALLLLCRLLTATW